MRKRLNTWPDKLNEVLKKDAQRESVLPINAETAKTPEIGKA
jgi:hypothetical protein